MRSMDNLNVWLSFTVLYIDETDQRYRSDCATLALFDDCPLLSEFHASVLRLYSKALFNASTMNILVRRRDTTRA
jgi:hypothetical protein